MVFTFYNQPKPQNHYLAYDAALILVVIVLLLLVASRIVVARTQRHAEGAPRRARRGGREPDAAPEPLDLGDRAADAGRTSA